jgi:hypothetical protein
MLGCPRHLKSKRLGRYLEEVRPGLVREPDTGTLFLIPFLAGTH